VHLPNLRDLDVSSPLFPFSAAVACLDQFAGTITSLAMTGRYHSYEDVEEMLRAFRCRDVEERLESLRLGSVTLTPQLVDLLAKELPGLYRLELSVREIFPRNPDSIMELNVTRSQAEHHIVSALSSITPFAD